MNLMMINMHRWRSVKALQNPTGGPGCRDMFPFAADWSRPRRERRKDAVLTRSSREKPFDGKRQGNATRLGGPEHGPAGAVGRADRPFWPEAAERAARTQAGAVRPRDPAGRAGRGRRRPAGDQ